MVSAVRNTKNNTKLQAWPGSCCIKCMLLFDVAEPENEEGYLFDFYRDI
jgi:hypothetical protein